MLLLWVGSLRITSAFRVIIIIFLLRYVYFIYFFTSCLSLAKIIYEFEIFLLGTLQVENPLNKSVFKY